MMPIRCCSGSTQNRVLKDLSLCGIRRLAAAVHYIVTVKGAGKAAHGLKKILHSMM